VPGQQLNKNFQNTCKDMLDIFPLFDNIENDAGTFKMHDKRSLRKFNNIELSLRK